MIFYTVHILFLVQLISAQSSPGDPVCEFCNSNETNVGQTESRIKKNENQNEFRNEKYISKSKVEGKISFNQIKDDLPKIWFYGSLPVPGAPSNSESPPDVDPYNFGSVHSPADPERTTEKTTVKPWRSSTTRVSAELTFVTSPPSIAPDYTQTTTKNSSESLSTSNTATHLSTCLSCETEVDQVPICDNFNQTHKSICNFAKWNCDRRMRGLEERVLVHIGACRKNSPLFTLEEEICPTRCPKIHKRVCDTSGTTHLSLCNFQIFNCQQRKLGNKNVPWLLYLKACSTPPPEIPKDLHSKVFGNPHSAISGTLPPESVTTPSPEISEDPYSQIPESPSPETPKDKSPESPLTTTASSRNDNSTFDCPDYKCPDEQNRICDSEGNFHDNECKFAHARCLAAKKGVFLRIMSDDHCNVVNCERLKTTNCSDDHDPVCGTDFITYKNQCFFQKAQCKDKTVEILFNNECKKCLNVPCPIIDSEDPSIDDSHFICDRNDETKSKCEFEMLRCIYEIRFGYNITEAYEGRCRKFEHDTLSQLDCSMDSDNNECTKSICKDEIGPVCGSDGITYRFDEKDCTYPIPPGVEVDYTGECCLDKCSQLDFNPVCDDSNVTYLNLCEFGKERCLAMKLGKKSEITITSYSHCENSDCLMDCPSTYDPVCSSKGETFGNECLLARAVCILNNSGGTSLSLDYKGECCKKAECDLNFEPVCDSEGRSHVNECVFLQEACLVEKKHGLDLSIEYPGPCSKKPNSNSSQS